MILAFFVEQLFCFSVVFHDIFPTCLGFDGSVFSFCSLFLFFLALPVKDHKICMILKVFLFLDIKSSAVLSIISNRAFALSSADLVKECNSTLSQNQHKIDRNLTGCLCFCH